MWLANPPSMVTPRNRCLAQRFSSPQTLATLAAADPGKNRFPRTDQLVRYFRTNLLDDAGDLMSQRERQRHATRGVEPLAAAEIGIAILNVKVGMAQSATFDPDQGLPPRWLGRIDDCFAERRIELDQRLASHERHGGSPWGIFSCCGEYWSIPGPWQQSR
jgi:hypothetical protein